LSEPFSHYDLTSARQHGRPGREIRPKSLTVDIHSHAQVPGAVEVVRGHLSADPHAGFYTEETRVSGTKQTADRTPYLIDLDLRTRTFDDMGVGAQVISPSFPQPQRFSKHYFSNVIGNPLDTTMALHWLIFDGVLERYPDLKIIAAHGGGYLPTHSGRIDHAWGARSGSRGTLPNSPGFYLKKIYFDTIVFTAHQLEAMVKLFGVDQILLGTDYPYDMGEYDPIGHIAAVECLSPSDVAAIAGGNAKRLFGI
jgi:predicted TIM-barrel fold metal-dependent hydrolase